MSLYQFQKKREVKELEKVGKKGLFFEDFEEENFFIMKIFCEKKVEKFFFPQNLILQALYFQEITINRDHPVFRTHTTMLCQMSQNTGL